MTNTAWSRGGTGVIIGGETGSLLASASLFASFAAEGLERYNRRVQRAADLLGRRDAGEEIDEVDTEFLEKFLSELAEFNAKGAVSATAAMAKRAARRRADLEKKAAAPVQEEFTKWRRENSMVTTEDGVRKFGTFLFSFFVFYMGLAMGSGWVLKVLS
jgi:UDP-N-acetylmuramoylalanine-D-glutamate ligase